MNHESVALNRAYFDSKASRFHSAFASAPAARTFELLPLLFFLGNCSRKKSWQQSVLADLLCGDGYFAKGLDGCFGRIHGVDLSAALLSFFPKTSTTLSTIATLDESTDILREKIRPDAIISVAGLHHIYEIEHGVINPASSDKLQVEVLLNWMACLPKDGLMVISDIPDPGSAKEYSLPNNDWRIHDRILEARLKARIELLAKELKLSTASMQVQPTTIGEYVRQVLDYTNCSTNAQPGRWFREVVAKKSLFGHVDHFPKPTEIVPGLRARGYNVEYYDLPTPLMFASVDSALYFMYEAFALGPKVESAAEIPQAFRGAMKEQIAEHLGIEANGRGPVSIGWRSGYYIITTPNEGNQRP